MRASLLEQQDGKALAPIQTLDEDRLPESGVTADVYWSSLDYEDTLAITGKGEIIRNFSMVPGIDFVRTVRTGEDPRFHAGQEVLLTGWGVDEDHWGGLAEQTRAGDDQLVATPQGLDARKAVIIGIAGFTTILYMVALEDVGVRPQDEEVIMTDAGDDIGSTAVVLLHKLGYQVVAVSGCENAYEYPRSSSASRILPRDEFTKSHPLERQIWAGAIGTVGDKVLVKVLA